MILSQYENVTNILKTNVEDAFIYKWRGNIKKYTDNNHISNSTDTRNTYVKKALNLY
jgi:hypothetical protein